MPDSGVRRLYFHPGRGHRVFVQLARQLLYPKTVRPGRADRNGTLDRSLLAAACNPAGENQPAASPASFSKNFLIIIFEVPSINRCPTAAMVPPTCASPS